MQPLKKNAFWGTPPFTVEYLEILIQHGYTPSVIITNPDRPTGRGMHLTSPAPKLWAEKHGIPYLQPEKLDDAFFDEITKESWDLFIVVAYGKILPERVINLPVHGTINVHYSLLPKYRGATPVESAILHGNTTTGISIQQMQYKLDTGPILTSTEVSIDSTETTPSLREKLTAAALTLLPETLTKIFSNSISPAIQDDTTATYCTKIAKTDGLVTLTDDPILLDQKFRAYTPWPGIFFMASHRGVDIRVKITKAHLNEGVFSLEEVVPENTKAMSFAVFQTWLLQ